MNSLKALIKNINKDKYQIYIYYYLIVIMGYILTLASSLVRPGVIASVLLLFIYVQCVLGRPQVLKIDFKAFNTLDILVSFYFIYNLASGVWCHAYGMPAGVWAGEFSTGCLTMVFYYIGRMISESGREYFYKWFIAAVYLVGFVGLVLYIWGPQFYVDYLFDLNLISKADVPTMRVRMLSVIGSILTGYMSVAGMLASTHILLKNNAKKGKILFFAGMLLAFLSNQRSAMVAAILVLLYVNYLIFFVFNIIPKKYFLYELIALGGAFGAVCIIYFRAILKVYYRLISLPQAVGERSEQWVGAVNNMYNLWLGNGLGANGHRANGITEHLIADGGLTKIFVELGIIGMSVFVFMMLLCFKYGIRNLRLYAAETGLIAITLIQSIGSNILEFQLATPIFWFAVGVLAAGSVQKTKATVCN